MCGTTSELTGTAKNDGGCACCAAPAERTAPPTTGSISLKVQGMTCGHCVSSVTEELNEVDGVKDVQVNLVPHGASTVTVDATPDTDPARMRAAVAEAGYEVIDS